ncbi:MAG: hypothetical protein K2N55_06290, partial [Lachnospiraceae bacterium]|nr:hypothetical protein [Lachnospiraceae bacterium]
VAGAAAYGAYHYLQTKDKTPSAQGDEDTDDDFDDFSEDLDEDTGAEKERSYVSLQFDKAEAMASEAFQKAKGVLADSVQQVKETVKSVKAGQSTPESSFTDLTAINKEKSTESEDTANAPSEGISAEASSNEASDITCEAKPQTPDAEPKTSDSEETVEEFFDDDL